MNRVRIVGSSRTDAVNSDQVKGKLKQLKGEIKRKWGKVTDNDVAAAEGRRSGDQCETIEK